MNIFFNHEETRARAGWRVGVQFFFMYLIGICFVVFANFFITDAGFVLTTSAITIGAVVSIWLAAKGLDNRPWQHFGVLFEWKTLTQCALGFILAGIAIGIIFLIEYAAGWITFTGFGWQQINTSSYFWSFSGYFLLMILVGFHEELVFRGYQIVNISEGLNMPAVTREKAVWGAVILSSVIFGIGHVFNPNAGWLSTINIVFAGIVLAFPFIITGRLSLSIGLHIGWNFFQGGIFGFSVSGTTGRASLIQIQQNGPDILTGGAFGPEAGLLGILGLILIIGGLLWYFKRINQPVTTHKRLGIYSSQPVDTG